MSWFEQLIEAIRLYNDGRDAECIAQVKTILSGPLSPYPRIRCRVLLAYALDDWYEADLMRSRAENLWNHWRTFWPVGRDARTDRLLEELRTRLDELAEEMRQTRPDDWMDRQLVWTDADAEDREAELDELEEQATEEAEYEEEEAVKQAEAEEEEAANQTEAEEEEAAKQVEALEEQAAEEAEAEDEGAAAKQTRAGDEEAIKEVEIKEEQAAEIVKAEEEEATELAEGEVEAQAGHAEFES